MKITDISDIFAQSRECARTIWNSHYRLLFMERKSYEVVEAYKKIRAIIVNDFIFSRTGKSGEILVEIGNSVDPRCVMSKERLGPQYVSWKPLDSAEIFQNKRYRFLDFFDFSEDEIIELRYVEIQWMKLDPLNSPNEQVLLAEFGHCRFFLADAV